MSDTTYEQDIDSFIAKWIEPDSQAMAKTQLKIIAVKAKLSQHDRTAVLLSPSSK